MPKDIPQHLKYDKMEQLYRDFEDPWDHGTPMHTSRNMKIVELAKKHLPPNASCIDIGCGEGYISRALLNAMPDLRLVAADISKTALGRAEKKINEAGHQALFMELDVQDRDKFVAQCQTSGYTPFDLVLAGDVFYYVDTQKLDETVQSVVGVTAPGSLLMLTEFVNTRKYGVRAFSGPFEPVLEERYPWGADPENPEGTFRLALMRRV